MLLEQEMNDVLLCVSRAIDSESSAVREMTARSVRYVFIC